MRNRLQYLYSISVFMGVLLSAYFMVQHDGNARLPFRSLQTPLVVQQAGLGPSAVDSLLEVETELARIRAQEGAIQRLPTRIYRIAPNRNLR